ncbi:hypothetical protein BV898_03265 [Hypsibius exemplaris]|uniref:MARVEL domain-containing protein n=1 Tax=Hypsibius exemplaris TaxID=2072580 RepID=A0A1W0X688_HYPEX|nr:hypothetical protein BV898_03265 [Hypsibius exemplaris]
MSKMPEPPPVAHHYPTQPYPPQGQQQQQPYPGPGQVTHHTTVIVRDEGCCGLRGRVQWVIGFNIVLGIINLLTGIVFATAGIDSSSRDGQFFMSTLAGLDITVGILMIIAGICLACALSKKVPALFTVWFVLIGMYAILNIALLGYAGYIYSKSNVSGTSSSFIVICVINLIIQVACISTVIKFKQSPLY